MTRRAVTDVKLRYVVRRKGYLFWQPKRDVAAAFPPRPLGKDGSAARAKGAALYAAWEALKAGRSTPKPVYPAGSLGAYLERFRRTQRWADWKPRTREDYERAWAHIKAWRPPTATQLMQDVLDGDAKAPTLAEMVVTQITTETCEVFAAHCRRTLSPSERYRTIKCLKGLLQDATVRLKLPHASPAKNLANPQAPGRSAIWLGAQVETLIKTSEAEGYTGMALLIAILWDTMFSPVDGWTLTLAKVARDADGAYVTRARTKTAKAAFGSLTEATTARLGAYVTGLGATLTPTSPIIRQPNGEAYRSKDTIGDHFRVIREKAFPGDERKLMDLRRSANVEARAGGAEREDMGELLANGLGTSAFLEDTYTPPTVALAREVHVQRTAGREKLKVEADRLAGRSDSAPARLVR